MRERLTGLEAVGLAERVTLSALDGFVGGVRARGPADFQVRPPGARLEYVPVVDIETIDFRHRGLVGFDLLGHPALRGAMALARDTGQPAATAQLPLVPDQPGDSTQVLFLLVPIFDRAGQPTTVPLRRAELRGYVFSAIRVAPMIESHLADEVHLRIEEPALPGGDTLVYEYPGARVAEWSPWALALVRQQAVAGQIWRLRFVDDANGVEKALPIALVVVGAALSYLLFRVTRFQLRARLAAEQAAEALRASQAALRASEAEAIAANRAKDAFLAMLSHELRTPLNAIMGWASMLRSGRVDESRRARALEVIERNAQIQARLIGDLFDVSGILSGKLQVDRRPIDLEPVVHAAFEAVRPQADEKQVQLAMDVAPEARHVQLVADPARIQQIVWNLLTNAIKFTPPSGMARLTLGVADGFAEIRVTDTGAGIPRDFLPHVFERFRQGDDTTTRQFGGMGLGLAIVQHLAEVHGGAVEARSDGPGAGAEFLVRLPVAAVADAAADVQPSEAEAAAGPGR
jgi:signal transduction histidine kinase